MYEEKNLNWTPSSGPAGHKVHCGQAKIQIFCLRVRGQPIKQNMHLFGCY